MLTIKGYPANPFQAGTFQLAYHSACSHTCNYLQIAAMAKELCCHFNTDCSSIPDFGRQLRGGPLEK
ncbi:hypothetical protein ACROYT_G015945 [Oculina patagonica]